MDLVVEVIIIICLTLVNGVFAMSELAIVASRKARLQQRAEAGDRRAGLALELARSPEHLLPTVQFGMTLIGIFAGAFGGATIAESIEKALAKTALAPYGEALSLVVVVVGITFLSLVIGELVPKRLALANPEWIAIAMSAPMRALSRIGAPFVYVLRRSTDLVMALLRVRSSSEPDVTQDEIRIMLDQGREAGVVAETEQTIVERVFRLGERNVNAVMSPRTDIVWIDIDDPIGECMRTMTSGGHTYYPVCRGSIENVVGLASVKDQWARMVNKQLPDLQAGMISPVFVPETMPALQLLETFKRHGRHLALVIDEYGGISGLVTLNDVLGSIVGDLPHDGHTDEPSAVRREDGSWLMDGKMSVDEFREVLGLSDQPDDDEVGEYQTLAGFFIAHLGRIPRVSDHVEWSGYRFEVVDMDGRRVDKILVARSPAPPPEPS